MRKILILDRIRQGVDHDFFEEMAGFEILTAYSNEDALKVHRRERTALIVTELFGSGMRAGEFCAVLRDDPELRGVSVIVCCRDNEIERAEAEACRANAVLTLPLGRSSLRQAAHRLLSIPARSSLQVSFRARRAADRTRQHPIDCRAENISVTGMLIEADAELQRGDTIQYALELSPQRTYTVQAEIVRIEQARMPVACNRYGVRFAGLVPAARRAIEDLVGRGLR